MNNTTVFKEFNNNNKVNLDIRNCKSLNQYDEIALKQKIKYINIIR